MLTVRRAEIKDIPTIMQFLEDHWLHGYILANDKDFFMWQCVHDDKVNVWIGIDEETGKIYGLQIIIYYTYDDHPDIAGSVWVVIKSPNPLLSFDIQDKVWLDIKPRASFSPGLKPDAVKGYKLLEFPIAIMDHYYRLANIDDYKIAVIKNKTIPYIPDNGYTLSLIDTIDQMREVIPEEDLLNGAPRKDYRYIQWRYFEHPIFRYDIWRIDNSLNNPCGILITRDECANGRVSCKIIDFYGNSQTLGKITFALDKLIQERGYEYIDIYSFGVPTEIYENAGLIRCDIGSDNIIPNYFQPYSPKNAEIYLVPIYIPGTRMFRGDGDQDKPRLPIN